MIIRELTGEDTEQYRALRSECLRLYPQNFGLSYEEFSSEPVEKTRKWVEESLQAKDKFLLGAFEGDRLIAITNFEVRGGLRQRHKGLINKVYVTPSEQGKGIAATLLDETLSRARLIPEMLMIHLYVSESNESAIKLYKARGFRQFGLEPKAFKYEDGSFSSGNVSMFLEFTN